MNLMTAAGVKLEELTDDLAQVLSDTAESFLRGGGTLTLTDWAAMEPFERSAFMKANRVIQVENALSISIALMGPSGMAELLDLIGIEELKVDLALHAAAERAVQEVVS